MQLAPLCRDLQGMMVKDEVVRGIGPEEEIGGARRKETSRGKRKPCKQGKLNL